MRAGPTSPPMPACCASRPAMRRSCAAAPRATGPTARSSRGPVLAALLAGGGEGRGAQAVRGVDAGVKRASEADGGPEYRDAIIAAGRGEGVAGAIARVGRWGPPHTDAFVTADAAAA